MQVNSNSQATSLTDGAANVQLLQAMVLAGLDGLVTWLPALQGQLLVIRTSVPVDGPASVLEPMLGDLARELAAAAKAVETVFDYAERAVWVTPAAARSTRKRRAAPAAAVKALVLLALVEYLKPRPSTTIRPKRAVLCRIIREKGLRSGKGIHDKTFSRWLSSNDLSYDSMLDDLWPEAQRLVAVTPSARQAKG